MKAIINVRSDTQTLPTERMRRAMACAEVGDDTYGDDPTVARLEAMAAERLGVESAMLTLSGTMSNLIAVMTHCRPSDEMFVDRDAHVVYYECGGLSSVAGVIPTYVESCRGHIRPDGLEKAVRGRNIHYPRARLVWLENTHNRGGGSVMPLADQRAVEVVARRRGLAIHLDGARIFNAAIAQRVDVTELTRNVDSVMVDLTKGLSCPLGSLLLGSRDFLAEAKYRRRLLGGGMRQAGVMAACGIVAFEELIERQIEDHHLAATLAARIAAIGGYAIDPASVETNMLYVDVSGLGASTEVVRKLREKDVLVSDRPPAHIRIVTHLQVTAAMADELVVRLSEVAAAMAERSATAPTDVLSGV